MKNDDNIKVGISIGDLNGIGCEVILKTFEDNRMLELCTPVIFGSTKVINYQRKMLDMNLAYNGIDSAVKVVAGKFNVVNVWKETPNIEPGKETEEGGKYAFLSLKAAVTALKNGEIDVLVTAPINKHNIQSEEFKFPGHTDYLAQELEGEALMFMVTNDLKVGLLTDHVPVKEVSNKITPKLVEGKINKIYNSLVQDFRVRKPKIAVLGINPHTGDNGVIGKEDDEVLRPVINKINDSGKLVYGPYAADSFFGSGLHHQFDAILASYHDQGLIPFKTLSFGKGVNYTAGLSKVRTSPDHGTAFEIAGKGEANHKSFEEAVFTAISIYRNREEYNELTKNPLEKTTGKL
ncbi:4-hydroxythreonine-4-phosphate dehydrogenase PdxA [Galbibacter pacificus]|uniref:4-hydroxythreonine-4-phosphate dehydrogenase PdxA n=1 Tax=Galbibacter pacificus TaxID=2996052 RepID=A0ABT6FS14_9FLAO|nr:4-hydroxythreonine-4-phosphate dehydrogenase PdxA [Galbibacter pacificus]MDG3582817.1 4-hydroxythreonine-4-phosphate dehydrogenase PdxA [Galbibacter pacificus]MDG3586064.1 4-hydroxythreonine-4-phosphate dehydrogenase PdxA [Galbibacter pacificus]